MAEGAPAVALLFADAEPGAQLREALLALGARIVHEGAVAAVRRADLAPADVVVVNLDAAVEEQFEQLYAALDESRQRVVFNDAEASRGLSGWDRARWARHLASKLVDAGDVDPPRPAEAEAEAIAEAPAVYEAPPAADARPADVQIEQRQTVATPPAAPADWDLVDLEPPPPPKTAREDAQAFGIEKQAAADFLAPQADAPSAAMELGSTLELVSMEEAVSPGRAEAPVHEMNLGGSGGGIRRVLLLGAAPEGAAAVRDVVAGLQSGLPALVLLVQHLQHGQTAEALSAGLAATAALPVRVAADGLQARQGEVLVLPAGQEVSLNRDGRLRLRASSGRTACDPSIDACFTMAAGAFGADVVAIVFVGNANDAVAGAQAVHDRGGRVWAQDPAMSSAHSMVMVAQEEGLVDFVGKPAALLARLREEYA